MVVTAVVVKFIVIDKSTGLNKRTQSMNIELNEQEAYDAMFEFLVSVYERTQSGTIGSLLGDMGTIGGGTIADPATWGDWLECVKKAKQGKVDKSLNIGVPKEK